MLVGMRAGVIFPCVGTSDVGHYKGKGESCVCSPVQWEKLQICLSDPSYAAAPGTLCPHSRSGPRRQWN